ncbi:reverse transcriptase domain-containing protein [Tanacetum coccineum]
MLKRCEDTNLSLNWEKSHFMVKEGIVLGHKISKSGLEVDRAKVEGVCENLAADHLSRLENPHQDKLENKEINEAFPLETLGSVALQDQSTPWFADFANYHAGNSLSREMTSQQNKKKALDILKASHSGPTRGHYGTNYTARKFKEKLRDVMRCHKTQSKLAKSLTSGGIDFMGPVPVFKRKSTYSWTVDTWSKWVKAKALPTNDSRVRILREPWEKSSASWSDKLDDALWAFRTAYKTPIGCTPYKLVYGKACHLPIELEHKAHWALKHINFDVQTAGDHQGEVQLNELNELR